MKFLVVLNISDPCVELNVLLDFFFFKKKISFYKITENFLYFRAVLKIGQSQSILINKFKWMATNLWIIKSKNRPLFLLNCWFLRTTSERQVSWRLFSRYPLSLKTLRSLMNLTTSVNLLAWLILFFFTFPDSFNFRIFKKRLTKNGTWSEPFWVNIVCLNFLLSKLNK